MTEALQLIEKYGIGLYLYVLTTKTFFFLLTTWLVFMILKKSITIKK